LYLLLFKLIQNKLQRVGLLFSEIIINELAVGEEVGRITEDKGGAVFLHIF